MRPIKWCVWQVEETQDPIKYNLGAANFGEKGGFSLFTVRAKMDDFLGSKTWTVPIGDANGTAVIAFSFIFLAYILHPAIELAYHRLRAYRAWRAIQKRKTVDVTIYPMLAEVFGGRGVWDAARIITVLLFAFSLASWGLELSMDLATLEGEADLLNRPPPVFLAPDLEPEFFPASNDSSWQVSYYVV